MEQQIQKFVHFLWEIRVMWGGGLSGLEILPQCCHSFLFLLYDWFCVAYLINIFIHVLPGQFPGQDWPFIWVLGRLHGPRRGARRLPAASLHAGPAPSNVAVLVLLRLDELRVDGHQRRRG